MKYRKFGKLEWQSSVLGFGAMRLPVIGEDRSHIDEDEAIRMIRYAIDQGVNYVDTAYPYHGGNSETLVGKALKNGYREKVKLATKLPMWHINTRDDVDVTFEEQLTKLQTERVDFYLFHGLNSDRWAKAQELNLFDWAEDTIAEGRIGHLGFSFHDDFEVFQEIVDGYDGWTFCQILYNYLDIDHQAGTRGLHYAHAQGLAIVVMEPIAGGRLAMSPPAEIQTLWETSEITRTLADLALQWVWNHPEVSVALSGMSTMQHVVENVNSATHAGPGTLRPEELALIPTFRTKYKEHGFIGCTNCQYCQPCPEGVDIPTILSLINEHYKMRGNAEAQEHIVQQYHDTISHENGVQNCVVCRECERQCPQQLPIPRLLQQANFIFKVPTE
jgi:predicted aldo/keto reductase-like oxidoreductase